MEDFPDWISIIDLENTTQTGGNVEDSPTTEELQKNIQEIFQKLSSQDGGKKSAKKKKSSSKRLKAKMAGEEVSAFDAYRMLANYVAEKMGISKSPRDRKPVHEMIKKLKEEAIKKYGELPTKQIYDHVRKMFDATHKK